MVCISIIVPIYNSELYLHKCIDSILNQSFHDWELLLVNDGSIDNSQLICEEYSKSDSRIRVFNKENGGVSSARNIGLKNISGEWVMFVDADDWLANECLELCLKEVRENDLDAVQFSHTIVYSDGSEVKKYKTPTPILHPNQYVENGVFNVCAGGGLYKASIIIENSLNFPDHLKLGEDQIFVLNFMRNALRIRFLDKPMYYYYQNDNSAVHNQKGTDLIKSCESLVELGKNWSSIKAFVDTMCLILITDMIKIHDLSYAEINRLYKFCSPTSIYSSIPNSSLFLYRLGTCSSYLAILLLSLYFRVFSK